MDLSNSKHPTLICIICSKWHLFQENKNNLLLTSHLRLSPEKLLAFISFQTLNERQTGCCSREKTQSSHIYRKIVIAKNILNTRFSLSQAVELLTRAMYLKKHSWTILSGSVEMYSLRAEFTYFRSHKAPTLNVRITLIYMFSFFFQLSKIPQNMYVNTVQMHNSLQYVVFSCRQVPKHILLYLRSCEGHNCFPRKQNCK